MMPRPKIAELTDVQQTASNMYRIAYAWKDDMAPYASMHFNELFDLLKNIPFNADPVDTEQLQRPFYTLNQIGLGGDCLTHDTRLLTPYGYVNISDAKPGMVIYGKKGWTTILNVWDKGILKATEYRLNNGGSFTATKDHILFDSDSNELKVSDLSEETKLLTPNKIEKKGESVYSPDELKFIGLFISDGWKDENRVCISGKDGHPKEAQKIWVKQFAEKMGWKTSWHNRYIRVYVPNEYPANILFNSGRVAHEKYISAEIFNNLSSLDASEILSGLYADAHQPENRRSGFCYSTTSKTLALQVRVLLKMQGFSCRVSEIKEHGGLGDHPIYRVYPRFFRDKPVTVESLGLEKNCHVFDIETEDHGIYLPDADIIVHNCDDKAICAGAWCNLNNFPFRFVAVSMNKDKQLHHVLTEIFYRKQWITFDPTYRFNVLGRPMKPYTNRLDLKPF